jgi:tetratricopeptide (TPR) repeat protein
MFSGSTFRYVRFRVAYACLMAVAIGSPGYASEDATAAATRLLEAAGFDAMLRIDAQLDAALRDQTPNALPKELRAQLTAVLDRTLGYAEQRHGLAAQLSTRFDGETMDRHSRWWTSSSGRAISGAQIAAFRELADTSTRSTFFESASPDAPRAMQSPFAVQALAFTEASLGARECLRMIVAFRRDCTKPQHVLRPGIPANEVSRFVESSLRAQYARIPAADLSAFDAYLDSPGARDLLKFLGEGYLRAKANEILLVHRAVNDAVAQFSHSRVGADGAAALRRVTALIDDGKSLEEARMILHLLRGAAPREPGILVELARVAIKQAPAERKEPGDPTQIDPEYLEDAQSWIDGAIALDPGRADTLVLAGHVAYLAREYSKSISLLERARRIGTANPWLGLNLADALWASGRTTMDRDSLNRAAHEFETALATPLTSRMRWHATHSLAHLYGDLEDFPKARDRFQRLISESGGFERAEALEDYASFLFFKAGDLDASIVAGRQAQSSAAVTPHHSILGEALLVKAGRLYTEKKPADAARLVREAQRATPGIEQNYSEFARVPLTLPAVFALHESHILGDLSTADGGVALVLASAHAPAADIERLVMWRADPNYLDPEEGTPLHMAVRARNAAAVRVLLRLGANVSVRGQDGRMPLELAESLAVKSSPPSLEILSMLQKAASRNPAAAAVGNPLRPEFAYQVLKGIRGSSFGHDLEVGEKVTFVRACSYSDPAIACLLFRDRANGGVMLDVALEKTQLAFWQEWFKELGPAAEPAK